MLKGDKFHALAVLIVWKRATQTGSGCKISLFLCFMNDKARKSLGVEQHAILQNFV